MVCDSYMVDPINDFKNSHLERCVFVIGFGRTSSMYICEPLCSLEKKLLVLLPKSVETSKLSNEI